MAKFGINDILSAKGAATGTDRVSEYKEIWLSPYEVKLSESNFYSQEKIEELADSFLAVGQKQPTVLGRVNGEFIIVSGHRRNLANILNIERGHEKFKKVRYLYKDMSPVMLELSPLMGNACNRELTSWEKMEQAQRLKEAMIRAKKEDGLEIKGKLREMIAELMNESSSGIARMDSIHNNAIPEVKEEFRKGTISVCAAYEATKLPEEEQKKVAEKATEGVKITAKEIAEKVMEQKDGQLSQGSNLDTGPKPQADDRNKQKGDPIKIGEESVGEDIGKGRSAQLIESGKIRASDKVDRHIKILQEWGNEVISMSAVTKAVKDAIQKVSNLDTSRENWTDIDWAVFTSKAIMHRADHVSEEDLYLLHDIMIRCREKQENT